MNGFFKNLIIFITGLFLLLSVLIVTILWTFSNNIPDYKFLKNYKPPVSSKFTLEMEVFCMTFQEKKNIYSLYFNSKNVIYSLSAEDKNFFPILGLMQRSFKSCN